jgi:hypothetical protein
MMLSLAWHTCSYVQPVKHAPLAPASPTFSWPRACGIPTTSAPQSAASTMADALLLPRPLRAGANWPAAASSEGPPRRSSHRTRRGACWRPGPTEPSRSWRPSGSAWASPPSSQSHAPPAKSPVPASGPGWPWGPTGLVPPVPSSPATNSGCARLSALPAPLRWPCTSATGPWTGWKPIRKRGTKRCLAAWPPCALWMWRGASTIPRLGMVKARRWTRATVTTMWWQAAWPRVPSRTRPRANGAWRKPVAPRLRRASLGWP